MYLLICCQIALFYCICTVFELKEKLNKGALGYTVSHITCEYVLWLYSGLSVVNLRALGGFVFHEKSGWCWFTQDLGLKQIQLTRLLSQHC